MNSLTVKKAIRALKEKHIIDDSLYNWQIQKTVHFLMVKFYIFQRFPNEKSDYYTVLV
jgi:hypothetical protein